MFQTAPIKEIWVFKARNLIRMQDKAHTFLCTLYNRTLKLWIKKYAIEMNKKYYNTVSQSLFPNL